MHYATILRGKLKQAKPELLLNAIANRRRENEYWLGHTKQTGTQNSIKKSKQDQQKGSANR
jgi:hypothetical protein